jgi:hypothetical protein
MSSSCEATSPGTAEPVVARAGERAFTSEALAQLLVLGQPLPLEAGVAEELSRHWLGLTLVTERWAGGDSLLSASDADGAMAFALRDSAVAELRRQEFPDYTERVRRRAAAVSWATEPRLVAHVLRRAGPESRPEERELQRRSAERLLAGLRSGRPWAWANGENEDRTSQPLGGTIGLVVPGQLPPVLDEAAFALEVDAYSPVIESPFGYHILYRPRPTGVWRERLEAITAERIGAEIDSVLLEEVKARGAFSLVAGATATARAVVRDPWRAAGRGDTLALMGDGALTSGDFAAFAAILPAETRSGLATAEEADVAWFVASVTEKLSLWRLAEARGIRPRPQAIDALRRAYRDDIRALAEDLAAAAAMDGLMLTAVEARQLASRRVIQALESIAARRSELRPVPPLLMLRLLEQSDWSFDASAIGPALERARVLIDASRPFTSSGSL